MRHHVDGIPGHPRKRLELLRLILRVDEERIGKSVKGFQLPIFPHAGKNAFLPLYVVRGGHNVQVRTLRGPAPERKREMVDVRQMEDVNVVVYRVPNGAARIDELPRHEA